MYLDMIHEKIAELKGVAQYLDWKKGGARTPLLSPVAVVAAQGKGAAAFKAAPLTAGGVGHEQRPVKRAPSGGQLLGKKFSGFMELKEEGNSLGGQMHLSIFTSVEDSRSRGSVCRLPIKSFFD